jgi:hypothetical protein
VTPERALNIGSLHLMDDSAAAAACFYSRAKLPIRASKFHQHFNLECGNETPISVTTQAASASDSLKENSARHLETDDRTVHEQHYAPIRCVNTL